MVFVGGFNMGVRFIDLHGAGTVCHMGGRSRLPM